MADSTYQAAMAGGDGMGTGQAPSDHVRVIVDNNKPVIGNHVGVMVGDGDNAMLWDPGGGYAKDDRKPPIRGNDGTISGANVDLDDYVNTHKSQNGPNVNVYDFPVTGDVAQQIRQNMGSYDREGLCAIDSGNALRGIGPFKDLGTTITPAMMDSEMRRLQAKQGSP